MTMTKGEPPTGGPPPRPPGAATCPPTGRRTRRRWSRRAGRCSTSVAAAQAHADRRGRAHGGADAPGHRRPVQLPGRRDPADLRHPRRLPEIRHVLVRHEQGGGHAADGYARASGKVGVCMGTSGPGATNLVTGDRHRPAGLGPDGRHHRQRARRADRQGRVPGDRHHRHHAADDQAQLPGPRTPTTSRASSPRRSTSRRTGRPGPVHVDITKDALQQETRAEHPSLDEVVAGLPGFRPTFEGHPKQLKLGRPRDRRGPAPADPGRPRRPDLRRRATSCGRSPRRRRSRSPGRCSASARSTRRIRSPTATWACTAGSTSTARSSRRTC